MHETRNWGPMLACPFSALVLVLTLVGINGLLVSATISALLFVLVLVLVFVWYFISNGDTINTNTNISTSIGIAVCIRTNISRSLLFA